MTLPDKWTNSETIIIQSKRSLKDYLFFRYEFCGYRNGTAGALGRLYQAFFVALTSTLLLVFSVAIFKSFFQPDSIIEYALKLLNQRGWNLLTSFCSIFAFVAALEISSYYQKWKYLSDLFNSIIKTEAVPHWEKTGEKKYSQREHLNACLAIDILVLEMWSHRSFFPVFKETLEKSIYAKSKFDQNLFILNLQSIDKVAEFEDIKTYLSSYIDYSRPKEDLLSSINPNIKPRSFSNKVS